MAGPEVRVFPREEAGIPSSEATASARPLASLVSS